MFRVRCNDAMELGWLELCVRLWIRFPAVVYRRIFRLVEQCNMLVRHAAVLLFLVPSISAYLLVVSDTDSPGLVLFDGGTPFYDRPARRYALNTEKSGDFVSKLLRVDHYTGSVILERPLECDGFKYPDVFTFYVDSTSNDTLEYMSVPLRMVIKGCEKNSEFDITYLYRQIMYFHENKNRCT